VEIHRDDIKLILQTGGMWQVQALLCPGDFGAEISDNPAVTSTLQSWAKHPWRVFWLSFPFVLFGALLLPSGFSIVGITLIGLSGVFALLSAIHGLCVAWRECRRRAIVILCSVWILLIISAVSEAWHLEENPPIQIGRIAAGFVAGPFWVLAAWVDQYVSDRLGHSGKRR